MTKYDDVLSAVETYRSATDKDSASKAHWALENAITSYAQSWSDDQTKEILDKVRLIKEISANAGLYDYPLASIKEYVKSILENTKIEDLPCYVEQLRKLDERYKAREKEAHELSEKIIALRSEIKARNKEQNDLEEQRNHNADCVKLRDDKIKVMEEALEAARLLCANLRQGGQGHMTLVDDFCQKDDKIK